MQLYFLNSISPLVSRIEQSLCPYVDGKWPMVNGTMLPRWRLFSDKSQKKTSESEKLPVSVLCVANIKPFTGQDVVVQRKKSFWMCAEKSGALEDQKKLPLQRWDPQLSNYVALININFVGVLQSYSRTWSWKDWIHFFTVDMSFYIACHRYASK